jgi:hypothetical protein
MRIPILALALPALSVLALPVMALSVLPTTPAFAETAAEAAADCETRLGFPPGGCQCIVAKWATFDENQRIYVAALARGDGAGAKAVEGRMSEAQLGAAGYFMATITSAFSTC